MSHLIVVNNKFWKIKDKQRRLSFKKNENSQLILKFLYDAKLTRNLKNLYSQKIFSKFSIKNKCLFTARSSSVLPKFKVSRSKFRSIALQGFLPGIRKSVW